MNSPPLSEPCQCRHNHDVGIIGIDADDREREHAHHMLEGFEHPLLGFVLHRAVHRPPGRNVSDRQGKAELTRRVPALMTDEIDLDEPGNCVVPVRPRPDRDLRLQQRARLRMGPAPRHHLRPLRCKPTVDRGSADTHEQVGFIVGEITVTAQHRHQHRQHRRESFASWRP